MTEPTAPASPKLVPVAALAAGLVTAGAPAPARKLTLNAPPPTAAPAAPSSKRPPGATVGQLLAASLKGPVPACASSMGCLCAGHARGNPAEDACDTREQVPPAPPAPAPAAERRVYTIGFGGGLTLAQLERIMKDRGLGVVIDTRASSATRVRGWSVNSVRAFFGTRYCAAPTVDAVKAMIAAKTSPAIGAVLLREEEAPGDSDLHLAVAAGVPLAHIFRNETIQGAELQRSIDAGEDYDCVTA